MAARSTATNIRGGGCTMSMRGFPPTNERTVRWQLAQEISAREPGAGSSRLERDLAERPDQRPLQPAFHAAENLVGVLPRHRRLVGPCLDQRRKNIRDRQQP